MVNKVVRADGTTVKIDKEEAEQADITAQAKRVISVNSEGGIIEDPASLATITISSHHHEIHEGKAFTTEDNASGGSGTKATITFTTPSGDTLIHVLVHYRCNVEAHSTLGEGPTITASTGTNKAPTARNRNNINASVLIGTRTATVNNITYGATVSSFGNVLEIIHFGNGKQGGEIRGDDEWVLKPSTTYAFEVESEAASSDCMVEIDWYERY